MRKALTRGAGAKPNSRTVPSIEINSVIPMAIGSCQLTKSNPIYFAFSHVLNFQSTVTRSGRSKIVTIGSDPLFCLEPAQLYERSYGLFNTRLPAQTIQGENTQTIDLPIGHIDAA
jgi:hypothetical protein